MSVGLEFLSEAKRDADEATRYDEEQVPELGARFRSEIESICAAIVRQPLLWRARRGGYRRVNLPGFPYYLTYFIRGERVLIITVSHASRHPDYWKRRKF